MKKLISLFLCFTFSLNSLAAVSGKGQLIEAFDNYHYNITVEWDQKDEKQFDQYTKALYEELDKLTLETGVSTKELESFLEARMPDKNFVESAKLKLMLLGKNPSRTEIAQFLKQESKNLYSRGASWSGDVPLPLIGFGIIFLIGFGYAVWFHATHDCMNWEYRSVRGDCYFDPDRYPSDPYFCERDTERYCTNWVKK